MTLVGCGDGGCADGHCAFVLLHWANATVVEVPQNKHRCLCRTLLPLPRGTGWDGASYWGSQQAHGGMIHTVRVWQPYKIPPAPGASPFRCKQLCPDGHEQPGGAPGCERSAEDTNWTQLCSSLHRASLMPPKLWAGRQGTMGLGRSVVQAGCQLACTGIIVLLSPGVTWREGGERLSSTTAG